MKSFLNSLHRAGLVRKAMPAIVMSAVCAHGQQAFSAELEEVIVTAQKRSESVQDVAAAITAIGSDRLVKSDFNNIQDLQQLAPSVQIGESFGFAQIMVRGIGSDVPFAGADPSVAMHIDGVVTGQASAQFGSLFDLERVEVLRGPQGTLYGRNTTGGSINAITRKPSDELEGYARVTAGNYELYKFEGAVGGPITDNLMGRIAVRAVDRGGYGENIYNGNDIDDANQESYRAQLIWNINDDMSLRLAAEGHEEDDTNYLPKFRAPSYDVNDPNLPAVLFPQPISGVRASDPRDINANVNVQNERDQESYSLEYNWQINDVFSFTLLSNMQEFNKYPQNDFDMTSNDFYIQSEVIETEQESHELRLTFDSERMRGLIGFFYYEEDLYSDNRLDLDLVPPFLVAIVPGLAGCTFDDNVGDNIIGTPDEMACILQRGNAKSEAKAIFGSLSYDISDALTLTLGARYSDEDRGGFTDFNTSPGNPVVTFEDKENFTDFSPSVRLEYSINDDVLVYASYSEGFKSGIFLSGGTTPVLDPEEIEATEIGLKGQFLDRSLQFNVAAFMYDYTDLQQGQSVPVGTSGFALVFENAASSEIEGIEAEFTFLANDVLRFDGSVTYLDATYQDYISSDPFDTVQQQIGVIPPDVDVSQQLAGNTMVQSPEWSYTLAATADFSLGEWAASGTVSAAYRDKVYFSQFNRESLSQDSVTTVNANLLFSSPDEHWTLNVWGKNLTDEEIYTGTFILNSSRTNAGFMAPPRTYGVTAGYNF